MRARPVAEREITAPVALCLPSGRLNPDAVGWTRTPLHDTSGIGRALHGWGRNKRWEYWGITTPTHIITLTVSAIDYAALHQVWVFDIATQTEISADAITPLTGSAMLPGSLATGPARARTTALTIDIDERAGGTRLRATTPRVQIDVLATRPDHHEAMGVVVPWNSRRFQYTVKDVDRPAVGTIRVDGVEHPVPAGASWAVLDHGRGRWPYSVTWNWGAASGMSDGHRVGVQLGDKWTTGTGSTENALTVDGRVHKISEELVWEYDTTQWLKPWRIRGERVDATFTPFYDRSSATNAVVIASRTHQCFGHYSGWIADDTGTPVRIDGLLGWAEDVHNRW